MDLSNKLKMNEEYNNAAEVTRFFNLIKSNLHYIILTTVMITIITVLVLFSLTPKFSATATLLLKADESKPISIQEVVVFDTTKKDYYLTQYAVLSSNAVANIVIDEYDLYHNPEFNLSLNGPSAGEKINKKFLSLPVIKDFAPVEKTVTNNVELTEAIRQEVLAKFKKHLTIEPVRQTQLVQITFTSEDPRLAANVANAIGQAYIENNLNARLNATREATSWLDKKVLELKLQLKTSQKELNQFLRKENLTDESGISTLASNQLNDLSVRLSNATSRRIEAEAMANMLNSMKSQNDIDLGSLSSISSNSQVQDIAQAKIIAEQKVAEYSKRYGPKHDAMIGAKAELMSVEQQEKAIVVKLSAGINKQLKTAKDQEYLLKLEVNKKKSNFQGLADSRSEYESLKNQVETDKRLYNLFLNRQKETVATNNYASTNAIVTDNAMIPHYPVEPKKPLIIIIAAIVSVVLSIIIILVKDLLTNTIKSTGDFESKFGLMPIGEVFKVSKNECKEKDFNNAAFSKDKLVVFNETFKSIRTSLFFSLKQRKQKIVAISSAIPGEGKSTVAINLASKFAKMEKTLIIDCDLRKPTIGERFDLNRSELGLANYLFTGTSLQECLHHDSNSGLTVLPAGMMVPNPQELLASDKFTDLLEELKEQFDRIIIDTSPMIPVSDALVVGKIVGSILMVVKADSTKINVIRSAMAKVMHQNINIEGVIVNQIDKKMVQHTFKYKNEKYGA
ncbi:polysaccharide biosynthesis tyrosine autokinase [Vibrio sp. SS-MA-C1-2]|uniref:GumC family protein n=1 Tax=Vibrio sp. SS-MA-C1-2 TaxID=2908646 RepID=UPI001F37E702|nr:polysaccharide biosynthesis tyrosine autokinase [Vibrio sp. SS-MA-C1-2]UJF17128.1 polysaccharide biosynthesis tyrosine autokinase [Vibrio sp. SS-MA-C1-2]